MSEVQLSHPIDKRSLFSFKVEPFTLLYPILLLTAWLFSEEMLGRSYALQFWLLTSIVLVHTVVEFYYLYRTKPRLFFLQPVVLGAIILFLLQVGGITNFLMIRNEGGFAFLYNTNIENDPYWLVFAMSVVLVASVSYWAGYKLSIGRHLFNLYHAGYKNFINYSVSAYALIVGWIIGCIIKLVINHYGGIGHKYIILVQNSGEIPALVSRLKVFEGMSLLFLMMMLFLVFQDKRYKWLTWILITGGIFELVFAITSGARWPIVFLFLSFFIVDYFFRGKIKIWYVIIFGLVLYGSMTILAKYKTYVFDQKSDATDVSNPIESIQMAIEFNKRITLTKEQRKLLEETARITAVSRFNYTNELAQMLQYKNEHGLDHNDPDFVSPMLTFPVFAILPKFYLFNIRDPGYGYWVTNYLTGGKKTSTAISPVGFAYLTGGSWFVAFIFLVFGILMKASTLLLKHIHSMIGFILFLAILQYLVLFDTVIYGTFINLIRFGLLLPPILWMFLKR